jgi:hypothetical protein
LEIAELQQEFAHGSEEGRELARLRRHELLQLGVLQLAVVDP